MPYHRPKPDGAHDVQPGIWQTQQGKYVCATCGSFNWHINRMRTHTATPHTPCQWCNQSFTHTAMHEGKCPERP